MIRPLAKPTFYFIGVSTGGSSSVELFPLWLEELGLPETDFRGHDIQPHGPARAYREIVGHIREQPLALGGLVTTHKIDIVKSAGDLFDYFDRYARVFGEISCISKRDGALRGHAKDPISAGKALETFLPSGYWNEHPRAQVFIMGAGGSGIALSAYLMREEHGENIPSRIIVSNRSRGGLDHCREVHGQLGTTTRVEYVQAGEGRTNDQVAAGLPPGSLVVNATGMGKDRPGSPLSEDTLFPENGYVWEFNYWGSLELLHQAERQAGERGLHVEDGLTYFVYGWGLVIGEVFGREITPGDIRSMCCTAQEVMGRG
jgi:shikimate 5-dehydrogenase